MPTKLQEVRRYTKAEMNPQNQLTRNPKTECQLHQGRRCGLSAAARHLPREDGVPRLTILTPLISQELSMEKGSDEPTHPNHKQ